MRIYQSFSSSRDIFFRPLAVDLAKPGLPNMFPLTWTSLSAVVVAGNTPSAPKATQLWIQDMAYGKLQSMHVSCLPLKDFITHLLLAQETAHHYNFSNILHAQPPVGHLRWAPPQPQSANRTVVN